MKKKKPIYSIDYYKRITKIIDKYKFKNFELITNYGLFSGDSNLFKTLQIKEIIDRIKNVKGDIIEFGVWRGNTSLLIKKILDIYKIKKKLYLFDHFKGLKHFEKLDKFNKKFHKYGKYKGNKKIIKEFINFFKFKDIEVIDMDAMELSKKTFYKKKFSLVILDVDLYRPTKKILEAVSSYMQKNSLIVFDEGNERLWPGEKKALDEFYYENKKNYVKEYINFARQPDVILKKVH